MDIEKCVKLQSAIFPNWDNLSKDQQKEIILRKLLKRAQKYGVVADTGTKKLIMS